jgi:spore maturation protein CgeB
MWRGLKIAFFGSSLVSAHLNPSADYFRGIVHALHELGHEITFYEPDIPDERRQPDIPTPAWAQVVIYPALNERDLYPLYTDAHDADLIIKASNVGVFDELLNKMLLDLRTINNLVIFWDVTPRETLNRLERYPEEPLRQLIPRYDLILTYGGGEPVKQAYKNLRAKQCETIYNALDPALYFPVAENDRFRSDLAFGGNRQPERLARINEMFFRVADILADHSFLLGGAGWEGTPLSSNVRYMGHIYPRDYNAFHCTPKFVLYLAGKTETPTSNFFEAAGAGACLITNNEEGIESFLEPGSEILIARNAEEAAEQIRSTSREQARAIGNTARKHLLTQHTYFHRAAQLERLIGASGLVRETVVC